MLDRFKTYIAQEALCSRQDSILLAVSGGVDSVIMTHLFHLAEYSCALAHCNFQLRGEESEADEAFVRQLGAAYEIPVYVERFDTEDAAKNEVNSIQMAARKLRYSWFEKLLTEKGFDAVATAHNLNDSVETCLINMTRGTGIRGLSGIPSKSGKVIRPMLFATRQDILSYSHENRIAYREDSSNASKKYHRNRIRHDIIPALEEINPGFLHTMQENMIRNKEATEIYLQKVEETRKELVKKKDNRYEIDVQSLMGLTPLSSWLFELFSPFGFTRLQCADLESLLSGASGKQFNSTSHMLLKDRNSLYLTELQSERFERYYLDTPGELSSLPFPMDAEIIGREELREIPSDPKVACLDYDKIQFPLTVRHWLHGDYFVPLGMEQLKKVSDFFIDQKIPIPLKNRIWILASGKKIVWIMGLRIDERFKISSSTRKILKLKIYDSG